MKYDETFDQSPYVWFLAYGSDIKIERFLYSLFGGNIGKRTHTGCYQDKDFPTDSRRVLIQNEIVFDLEAILAQTKKPTYARLYRVSHIQFWYLYAEYNYYNVTKSFTYQEIKKAILSNVRSPYQRLLFQGLLNEEPIFTFGVKHNIRITGGEDGYIDAMKSGLSDIYDQEMIKQQLDDLESAKLGYNHTHGHPITLDGLNMNYMHRTKETVLKNIERLNLQAKNEKLIVL